MSKINIGDLVWGKYSRKHKLYGVVYSIDNQITFTGNLCANMFVVFAGCKDAQLHPCMKGLKMTHFMVKVEKLRLVTDLIDRTQILENLLRRKDEN